MHVFTQEAVMFSRREVVTGGALGALASVAEPPEAAAQGASDAVAMANGLNAVKRSVDDVRSTLDRAFIEPGVGGGQSITKVRQAFDVFIRANGHFPAFCEIGLAVFYDVYDWHIKHNQQIQMIAINENRMAIQFMFTQLVLRWENDPTYIGPPFDR